MPEIDPSQLFDHFVEAVRLLAASAQEQIDWVDSKNLPISELTLQFSDVYPVFAPRLQENGLITDADVRRLERVKTAIHDLEQDLSEDPYGGVGVVQESPDWEAVRSSAREVLLGLQLR